MPRNYAEPEHLRASSPRVRGRDRSASYPGAVLSVAKREPSAFLFAGQILGVLLYPFMTGSVGRAAFSLFGIAILGLVVLAVHDSPGLTWVAIGSPSRQRRSC